MSYQVTFVGTKCQLRIDGEYAATYDSLEDLETAVDAYSGRGW
jgi:hypothetical protein